MNIYYSRSNNVDDSVMNVHIGTFIQNLPEQLRSQVTLTKYERGTTYDPQLLHKADLVIVGMPELNPDVYLGKGCFTEVETALKEHKPVLIISKDRGDTDRIMMQTMKRSDLQHCGNNSVNYGKFYLYHNYDECYLPACNEHNMMFYINSKEDIHDAMSRFQFIGDDAPVGEYHFDDKISFIVKGVEYKFIISSDWLNPEDVDIDRFFYNVLGVTDRIINTAVQKALDSEEDFDNVNLWPIRNRRAMNKVIPLIKSWVDVANGVETKADVTSDDSYKFDQDVMININGKPISFKISAYWFSCNDDNYGSRDLMQELFGDKDPEINYELQKVWPSSNMRYHRTHLWELKNPQQMNAIVKYLLSIKGKKTSISTAESVQQELPLPNVNYQVIKPNPSSFITSEDDELLLLM